MTTSVYTIRLEDQASQSAARVASAMKSVAAATERVAAAAHTQDRAYQAVARTAERYARLELKAARAVQAVDKAALRSAGNMGGLGKMTARFNALNTTAGAVAGIFSAQLIGSTVATGRALLEAAGNAQVLERNFARVTGDPKELEQTRALIRSIGLDLEAGEKAALKLRTSFGRFTAESLLKTFSALSLSAGEIDRASLALSQIQGRGKLQAEELNQFVEAVPGADRGKIIDQIAKEMKITRAAAADKLGKGQIAADVGVRALIFGALESQKIEGNAPGNFGGVDRTIAAGAGDINRQLVNLDNTILEVKRNFGAAIASPAVIGSLNALGGALKWVSTADPALLRAIALGVGAVTLAFGGLGLVAGYLAIVSAGVGVLTGTLIPAATAAWAFVAPFLAAAAPFLAAGAAIAFLGYQVTQLWNELGGWAVIWPAIQKFFTDLGGAAMNLGVQALDWGRNLVAGLVAGITESAGSATAAISNMASGVVDTALDVFGIRSPSKVFAEQGRFIDEGLAMGVEDHQDLAFASAESLADGVVSEAELAAAAGSGINQAGVTNVGAAAGAALGGGGSGGGITIGSVPVTIHVDGAAGPAATVQAIRSFFETDFAALLERQLEGSGA
jgi:tape measure domain-containing protein